VLAVYAHPSPKSFCQAVLLQFTKGLEAAGHTSEVVDLYAIGFDPVFRTQDFASYVHESMEGWHGEAKGRVPTLHHE
jgi:NAD(P)H dehydrogenase (quinone)